MLDEGHPKVHELGHEIPKSIQPSFLGAGAFLEANKCQGHGLESHCFQN